jgi:cellulose synthase/poly-beta-1,6-N-acetylglucosamine synthase-like glycosyltransferase
MGKRKGICVKARNSTQDSLSTNIRSSRFKHIFKWLLGLLQSAFIASVMFFIIVNFYLYSSVVNLDSFIFVFLFISLLTDGAFMLMHITRTKVRHKKLSFTPSKLTIVICCYNGEDVIGETIRQAMTHVPPEQIIVVSDASTDKTVSVARSYKVRVVENIENVNKAFSVNAAVMHVETPYVLLLDDDTLIGATQIPTNLLDEGYSAVAFNVMPMVEKGSVLNALQQFEYRMSMQLGKNVRAGAGAIGNISGAIGLYHTKDLVGQTLVHSGQFAGEDEQRTILTHLSSEGKGITYTDSLVLTQPPRTYKDLFRQRAFSWSLAAPELFTLYWRILLEPKHHFLLKSEKAYKLYVYLTDPLRMLFFWTLVLRPLHFAAIYVFYVVMNIIIWLKMGAVDSFSTVLLFPFYSLMLTVSRFVGHFYWIKVKLRYLAKRLHRRVKGRKLIFEYSTLLAIFVAMWLFSSQRFAADMRLFSKIKNHKIDTIVKNFDYEKVEIPGPSPAQIKADNGNTQDFVYVPVEKGDTPRSIAHKAIDIFYAQSNGYIPSADDPTRHSKDTMLASSIKTLTGTQAFLPIEKSLIDQTINKVLEGK